MRNQTDIRHDITNAIIDALQNNPDSLPPWRKPWCDDPNSGLPTSLSTGRRYAGINTLILQCSAMKQGFKSRWWGTFNQIKHAGSCVRKGQKSTKIVLWKPIKRTRVDEHGKDTDDNFMVMREFAVFNCEQTTGLDEFRVGHTKPDNDTAPRYQHADDVIDATGATINYGGNRAFYSPSDDTISMPFRHQFETPEAFFETCFHELCHFAESRTGFDRTKPENSYSFGELVAEMGSCFLMGELGLPTTDNLENHAAYLKSWLSAMAEDSKFIFKASAQASKASDFLLSFSRTTEDKAEPLLT
ncbi:ArdC family protein [Novipirellula rosea]|uniref:Zincin-like metallopeptidase domain-containing protein n=1 Tax=Novipirellula rosea TaxID=1031540 RepID=A0ABP8M456_9BACT